MGESLLAWLQVAKFFHGAKRKMQGKCPHAETQPLSLNSGTARIQITLLESDVLVPAMDLCLLRHVLIEGPSPNVAAATVGSVCESVNHFTLSLSLCRSCPLPHQFPVVFLLPPDLFSPSANKAPFPRCVHVLPSYAVRKHRQLSSFLSALGFTCHYYYYLLIKHEPGHLICTVPPASRLTARSLPPESFITSLELPARKVVVPSHYLFILNNGWTSRRPDRFLRRFLCLHLCPRGC